MAKKNVKEDLERISCASGVDIAEAIKVVRALSIVAEDPARLVALFKHSRDQEVTREQAAWEIAAMRGKSARAGDPRHADGRRYAKTP